MALASRLFSRGITPHCLLFHDAAVGTGELLCTSWRLVVSTRPTSGTSGHAQGLSLMPQLTLP